MSNTFYLKYRPQLLAEIDLEAVRERLINIVKSGKIPQGILFSGPKGIGKTSAARILAKIVNCENPPAGGEPCNKCDQCSSIIKGNNLDVIELDAASHRGIDDVRSLREGVKLSAAKAKKKVFIIDEAHMLTTEASNALLKTLEEPPSHVVFILATTNPEKLLQTVRSRLVNIVFRKASTPEIKRQLTRVIKAEGIKIEEGVVELIAKASEGSFRDAVKILEQISLTNKTLKRSEVENFLLQNKVLEVEIIFELLSKKDVKGALSEVERVMAKDVSASLFIEIFTKRARQALLTKLDLAEEDLPGFGKEELIALIDLFSKAQTDLVYAVIPQLPIEIAIIKWCQPKADLPVPALPVGGQNPKTETSSKPREENSFKDINEDTWHKILAEIKPKNTSVEALLKAAKPVSLDGEVLTLGVFYKFHKERLENIRYRELIEGVIETILGRRVKVICVLTQEPKRLEESTHVLTPSDGVLTEPEDKDIIKVAKEIFGN